MCIDFGTLADKHEDSGSTHSKHHFGLQLCGNLRVVVFSSTVGSRLLSLIGQKHIGTTVHQKL